MDSTGILIGWWVAIVTIATFSFALGLWVGGRRLRIYQVGDNNAGIGRGLGHLLLLVSLKSVAGAVPV